MKKTVIGIPPVEGTDPLSGSRDFKIELLRDGCDPIAIGYMLDGKSETFDPTLAVEFTTEDDPDTLHCLRVGDVLTIRVVVNT